MQDYPSRIFSPRRRTDAATPRPGHRLPPRARSGLKFRPSRRLWSARCAYPSWSAKALEGSLSSALAPFLFEPLMSCTRLALRRTVQPAQHMLTFPQCAKVVQESQTAPDVHYTLYEGRNLRSKEIPICRMPVHRGFSARSFFRTAENSSPDPPPRIPHPHAIAVVLSS